jgi:hypothetical protein
VTAGQKDIFLGWLRKECYIRRRVTKDISRVLLIARLACQMSCPLSFEYFKIVLRNIKICRRQRYTPLEAFRLGTFAPDFDICRLGQFISRKRLTGIQKKLNPEAWAEMVKNKAFFYRHCLASDIKIPDIYAFCLGDCWHRNDQSILSSVEEKEEFIEMCLPDSFIVKPVHGAYGKWIDVFERNEMGFVDSANRHCSAIDIIRYIESQNAEGYIIQQTIENHSMIARLTGTQALQTVRIITFVNKNRNVSVVHSHFKTITRPGIVIDTHLEGLTGNVEVPVDIETGILGMGNQLVGTGEGIVNIPEHPITGVSFARLELPDWECACEMVKEASVKFLPIRTIGWDVALSPNGPCIIEGNIWWDAPNQHMRMAEILEVITDEFESEALEGVCKC